MAMISRYSGDRVLRKISCMLFLSVWQDDSRRGKRRALGFVNCSAKSEGWPDRDFGRRPFLRQASPRPQGSRRFSEFFRSRETRSQQQFNVVGYCSGAGVAMIGAAQCPQMIRCLALVSGEFVLPASQCRQTGFQREVDLLLPSAAASKKRAYQLYDKIAAGRRGGSSEFHEFTSVRRARATRRWHRPPWPSASG